MIGLRIVCAVMWVFCASFLILTGHGWELFWISVIGGTLGAVIGAILHFWGKRRERRDR